MEQNYQKPLSSDEAAAFLGYSKAYLHKLVYQKKVPYYKPLNGRLFFKREELERFIYGEGGQSC